VAQHRIHIGRVSAAMRALVASIAPQRIWVLIDEWSVIPVELQPFLADLLRRSLFPVRGLTVKIGSIEHRTHLRLIGQHGDYVGIELGADAAADINLDEFMVYEDDPDRATRFFLDMFFRHVQTLQDELPAARRFRTASELLRSFEHRAAFEELVRAAEGVPRDAINIVALATQRAYGSPISVKDIRVAAKTWYQRDKDAALANAHTKRLLDWIIDEVLGKRSTRGFLLPAEERYPLIDSLFDARVLHLLKRGISAQDRPGLRFNAYKLDYGCYVDLLSTQRRPRGLFERASTDGNRRYADLPPDDYAMICRATLDIAAFENS
jgi:hypothetical protein